MRKELVLARVDEQLRATQLDAVHRGAVAAAAVAQADALTRQLAKADRKAARAAARAQLEAAARAKAEMHLQGAVLDAVERGELAAAAAAQAESLAKHLGREQRAAARFAAQLARETARRREAEAAAAAAEEALADARLEAEEEHEYKVHRLFEEMGVSADAWAGSVVAAAEAKLAAKEVEVDEVKGELAAVVRWATEAVSEKDAAWKEAEGEAWSCERGRAQDKREAAAECRAMVRVAYASGLSAATHHTTNASGGRAAPPPAAPRAVAPLVVSHAAQQLPLLCPPPSPPQNATAAAAAAPSRKRGIEALPPVGLDVGLPLLLAATMVGLKAPAPAKEAATALAPPPQPTNATVPSRSVVLRVTDRLVLGPGTHHVSSLCVGRGWCGDPKAHLRHRRRTEARAARRAAKEKEKKEKAKAGHLMLPPPKEGAAPPARMLHSTRRKRTPPLDFVPPRAPSPQSSLALTTRSPGHLVVFLPANAAAVPAAGVAAPVAPPAGYGMCGGGNATTTPATSAAATARPTKRHATINSESVAPEADVWERRRRARQEMHRVSERTRVYVPYNWVDPDANADFRASAYGKFGIATNDKYAAWCRKHACYHYNKFSVEWCAAGGADACKNECRRGKDCPKPRPSGGTHVGAAATRSP